MRECDYNQHISTEPHALSSVGAGWVSVKVPTSSWGGEACRGWRCPTPTFQAVPPPDVVGGWHVLGDCLC